MDLVKSLVVKKAADPTFYYSPTFPIGTNNAVAASVKGLSASYSGSAPTLWVYFQQSTDLENWFPENPASVTEVVSIAASSFPGVARGDTLSGVSYVGLPYCRLVFTLTGGSTNDAVCIGASISGFTR